MQLESILLIELNEAFGVACAKVLVLPGTQVSALR